MTKTLFSAYYLPRHGTGILTKHDFQVLLGSAETIYNCVVTNILSERNTINY